MRCRQVEELLSSFLEGLLPERRTQTVAAHLEECPACRGRRDAFTAMAADLRALEPPPPPADLERRIAARWDAETTRRQALPATRGSLISAPRPLAPVLTRLALGATAAIAVLIVAAVLFVRSDHRRPSPLALSGSPKPGATDSRTGSPIANRLPTTDPGRSPQRSSFVVRRSSPQHPTPQHPNTRLHPGSQHPPIQDDLAFLNGRMAPFPVSKAADQSAASASLQSRPRHGDDFVTIPLPRIVAAGRAADQAAARAAEAYEREAAVVDERLARKVTLALKATALSDLCDRLRAETEIHLTAGRSVADEKVTLFCKEMPLRDVMRQLGRPFGYAWLRSGAPSGSPNAGSGPPSPPMLGGGNGGYRYELVQDLASQLEEEQLRDRDRNAALLALDAEMNQFRRYLHLSPEEARARARNASPEEKRRLERYADLGWGPAQMYFQLSPQDLAALREGRRVTFSAHPAEGEQRLPPELERGVLQSLGSRLFYVEGERFGLRDPAQAPPGARPVASVPEVRVKATLEMARGEIGQFTLVGGTGVTLSTRSDGAHHLMEPPLAVGVSPSVSNPQNATANARLAGTPALQRRVTIEVKGHGTRVEDQGSRVDDRRGVRPPSTLDPRPSTLDPRPSTPELVTSADVLEALHQATGIPIVADYYTRLHPASALVIAGEPLFDALNKLADTMRLRWSKDGPWLQFRGAAYFQDRLKEVPNRLLQRWAASHREHGALTLEDMIEIAQLSDAQLSAREMAQGARLLHGLEEWPLPANRYLRHQLRFLAELTPTQRQQTLTSGGLPFRQLSLPQQQRFVTLALGRRAEQIRSLDDLAQASLRVDYTPPGWFQWAPPQPPDAPHWHRLQPVPVRERTREAALQAARRLDPHADASQVQPTEPTVIVAYILGPPDGPLGPPVGLRTNGFGTYHTVSTPIGH